MNANKAMEKKLAKKKLLNSTNMNYPYQYSSNGKANVVRRNTAKPPSHKKPTTSKQPTSLTTRQKNHSRKKTLPMVSSPKSPSPPMVSSSSPPMVSSSSSSPMVSSSPIVTKNIVTKNITTKTVSVVMVASNSRKYIYNAIYTILKQSHTNLNLIIIDNNSQDGTVDYIKNIKDSRIKIYSLKEETTLANCRNLGLYVSTGDYITFQDPHYISISERLEKQLLKMSDDSVAIVGDQIKEENASLVYNYSSLMLSRKQFNTHGFFKNNNNHMLEYIKRLKNNNVTVENVDNLYYIRYDILSANNEFLLPELAEYPDDEVSLDKRVEFQDLEKFDV